MVSTMVAVIIGLASLAVGLALGIWYASAGKSAEATKASEVQQAFDDYKTGVNAHFGETAKHFAAIGQEYRALYSHMANSAETLLGADSNVSQEGFPRIAANNIAVEADADDTGNEQTPPNNEASSAAESAPEPSDSDTAPEAAASPAEATEPLSDDNAEQPPKNT